jgi:hypothetical protein
MSPYQLLFCPSFVSSVGGSGEIANKWRVWPAAQRVYVRFEFRAPYESLDLDVGFEFTWKPSCGVHGVSCGVHGIVNRFKYLLGFRFGFCCLQM